MILKMKTIKKDIVRISTIVMLVGAIFLSSCSDDFKAPSSPSGTTIADVAAGNDSLKAFVAVLAKTGLAANFANINGGQFTVFAPSNYSFIKYLRASGYVIGGVDASTAGDAA